MNRIDIVRRNILPPLLPSFYKGQLGKLAVIGGCEDYTGAPYFSAHSAMLSGVDLVHIICEQAAAPVIKSYSPDLMVHPYILDSNSLQLKTVNYGLSKDQVIQSHMDKIIGLVSSMDALIIGPGFGRNDETMNNFLIFTLEYILTKSEKKDQIPIILDADALYHLSTNSTIESLIKDSTNPNIILTPNVIEYKRLCNAFGIEGDITELAKLLNVTVIQKGPSDRISYHGHEIIECNVLGSLKRVGGQGDSLTGMIGAFLCWSTGAYKKGIYPAPNKLSNEELISLSCLAGCTTTRMAGHYAYTKYGRAMLTSNLHEFISKAFTEL